MNKLRLGTTLKVSLKMDKAMKFLIVSFQNIFKNSPEASDAEEISPETIAAIVERRFLGYLRSLRDQTIGSNWR